MNIPFVRDPALRPTRRVLMQLIGVKSGGIYNRRAERLVIRGMFRDWPERVIEKLLEQLLFKAEVLDRAFATYNADRRVTRTVFSLARANGCDSPVSAREPCPKTPAAGEQVCHVVAASALTRRGDASACATRSRPTRDAIV